MSTAQTQLEAQLEKNIELITKASRDLSINTEEQTRLASTPKDSAMARESSFPLFNNLPSELRHEIYAHYFASLPPQQITCTSITSYRSPSSSSNKTTLPPYHTTHALALSSPLITFDIPPFLYYQYTTFQFPCASALKTFYSSSHSLIKTHVRKIRILYGNISNQSPDWVFLILSGFENLREVTWVVDEGCKCCGLGIGSEKLERWWGCVGDAVREGTKGRCEKEKGREIKLRLEVKRGSEVVVVKGA